MNGYDNGTSGDGLQLLDLEDSQIRLPALEFEQRIVVATQGVRQLFRIAQDPIEHPADGGAVEHAGVHGKPDDPAGAMTPSPP